MWLQGSKGETEGFRTRAVIIKEKGKREQVQKTLQRERRKDRYSHVWKHVAKGSMRNGRSWAWQAGRRMMPWSKRENAEDCEGRPGSVLDELNLWRQLYNKLGNRILFHLSKSPEFPPSILHSKINYKVSPIIKHSLGAQLLAYLLLC